MMMMGSFEEGGVPGIPFGGVGSSAKKKGGADYYWSPKFNSLRNSKSVDSMEQIPRLVEKSKDIQR